MMKQSLGPLLILGLSLSLNAQTSMNQANSATYLKAPESPKYETCGYTTIENGHGSTYQVQDSACIARNQEKQRNYNAAVEAYNRSTRMISSDASNTVKPKEPTYEDCQTMDDGNGQNVYDYACQSRNQAKQHDYNIQSAAWNKLQQEQAIQNQAAQSEEQRRALEESKAASATEALQKAQEQNIKSAQRSNRAATITTGISVGFGVAFAVSCSTLIGCNYGYLASSIAFGMMSAQSSRQAAQNNASAYAACTTQAQLNSTSVGDCSTINSGSSSSTGSVPSTNVASTAFDSKGNCVAADHTICDQISANLPAGTNIKDVGTKINSFATSAPWKFNSDGSVTTKDGKTFKPEDFKSKEAMMAAGLTADQAAMAMGALGKAGSGLGALPGSAGEKALADLKGTTTGKDGKSVDFGGLAISGSGADGGAGSGAGSGGASSSGALSSKAIGGSNSAAGKDGFGKRNPAGAGLTRDFNGETIGAAGDDIFSMMNRRYKMKTAQDSFISN